MRIKLLIIALFWSIISYGQKTISCKKGDIKQNGTVIASYDGKGGIFKLKKIGVFAPGSKDTLIRITEDMFYPNNPLFPEVEVFYKVEFIQSSLPHFYVTNRKDPSGRLTERGVVELLFNDTVPLLINNGKPDEAALVLFREKYTYDYGGVQQFVKRVEDSIAVINAKLAIRDMSKPVYFKLVNDKSVSPADTDQTFEMYQGDVLLGRMIKKVRSGDFAKATYTIWKSITPVMIEGIDMKYSPVAICSTGPSVFEIPVITVAGKKELKIKGNFSQLETLIVNALIANKFL